MSRIQNPIVADATRRVVAARDRLIEKYPDTQTMDEVIEFLFTKHELEDSKLIDYFKKFMKINSDISVNEKTRTYRYRPPYDIRKPSDLINYFQTQDDTIGISVVDLKKGWKDCDDAINKLELENKLLVLRNRKDHSPKFIYADDSSLTASVNKEFIDLFASIPLPGNDDVVRYIQQSGRTPAGAVAENKAIAKPKAKVRKNRQSTKQTNKHMQGLFKDYSALRQKGK